MYLGDLSSYDGDVSFEVAVPSVTKCAAEICSPVCINMFTLVNDLSAAHFAQFVTINVDGTATSNDTCAVITHSHKSPQ